MIRILVLAVALAVAWLTARIWAPLTVRVDPFWRESVEPDFV